MEGAHGSSSRADTAFTGDFLNLIAKNCPLNLFDNPLPILKAQPEALRAEDPVRSSKAVKLMNSLLLISEGRFDRNPNVHGSTPRKELTSARAATPIRTPMFCPLPCLRVTAVMSGRGDFRCQCSDTLSRDKADDRTARHGHCSQDEGIGQSG
jgi:hypothetical protein